MSTNFESNLELEKHLEAIHVKIKFARDIVESAKPNTIPVRLTRKLDFLDVALNNLKILAKSKERP